MPSEPSAERLHDIIANVDRIRAHLVGVSDADDFDAKTRDAVERCLERISEAARKLGPVMEERRPDVAWRSIRGLGNVLRHDYDVVDDVTITRIARNELAVLRQACIDELGGITEA